MTVRFALLTTLCFLGAYLLASALDLWTTDLALSLSTAREGNAFALDKGAYDATRAWLFTAVAAVPLTALFCFGMLNRDRIAPRWLEHPWRSFLSLRSNPIFSAPWSKAVIDRTPLHAIAFATAFVALRLIAAANNLMIVAFGVGPLGSAVGAVGKATSPLIGFAATLGTLYVLLILVAASVVARQLNTYPRPNARSQT